MSESKNYQSLQLKELKLIAQSRNIDCKETKEDLVRNLTLYDQDKYVYPTTYEKDSKGFIIGISLNNTKHLANISRLVEKGEARCLNMFYNDRVHYWGQQKLL